MKVKDENTYYQSIILANNGKEDGVARPKSMCLDPLNGRMFWLDDGGIGVPAKVGRANMDGTESIILHMFSSLEKPEAITIDVDAKTLYWSTSNEAKVSLPCFLIIEYFIC